MFPWGWMGLGLLGGSPCGQRSVFKTSPTTHCQPDSPLCMALAHLVDLRFPWFSLCRALGRVVALPGHALRGEPCSLLKDTVCRVWDLLEKELCLPHFFISHLFMFMQTHEWLLYAVGCHPTLLYC